MFSRLRIALLLLLLPAVLTSKPPASRPQLVDFDWRGDDIVLVFSDSVGYQVDLAASDTSQVILRLKSIDVAEKLRQRVAGTEAPTGNLAISLNGPGGRTAALSQRSGGETSLHVHDDERLGYSVEWRPYTRQLVIHTFDWDRLDYGAEQFHQGLIAIEQGITEQAEEHLQLAGASGELRAHAALASMYARRGEDSLALYYLKDASTGEEYAALADIQKRAGDTAAADASRARSEQLLGDRRPDGRRHGRRDGMMRSRDADADDYNNDGQSDRRNSDVILLASIGGLALILIVGLLVLSGRKGRNDGGGMPPPPPPPGPGTPPAPRRDPAGFRVVDPNAPADTRTTSTTTTTSSAPRSASATTSTDAATHASSGQTAVTPPATPPPAPPTASQSTTTTSMSTTSSQPRQSLAAAERAAASSASRSATSTWERASDRGGASKAPASSAGAPAAGAAERAASRPGESTVDAARRMGVSRDNVELRRRMDEASRRDTNAPD